MEKEIEIYDGKKILVDFGKVERYICNIFLVFLCIIFPCMLEYNKNLAGMTLKAIILIVVSIVTMICIIASKILSKNFKLSKYSIILLGYLVCITLSYMFSEYRSTALLGTGGRCEGLIMLICYCICFFITFTGFKYNSKLFDYITCAVLIASCFGIVQALLSDNYNYWLLGKFEYMGQSNFGNPNMFSSFLMIFIPIYLVKYYKSREELYLYILGILFAALVGSKTSGGYITFVFVLVVLTSYFIVIWKNKKEIILKFGKLLIVFFTIFVLLNSVNNNAYYKEIISTQTGIRHASSDEGMDKFGSGRGFIWSLCIQIISKNPWFGVGPDSLGCEVMNNYIYREGYKAGRSLIDKAHNEILHIAVTTGIPSAIIYTIFLLVILISLLIKYIKNVKAGKILENDTMIIVATSASIVAYIVQSMANISIFAVAPIFWAMLGIGAKISSNELKES